MNANVLEFFKRYDSDPQLRAQVKAAEDAYPGSLEIRDAVAEASIIPIAAQLGLPFDVKDLRAYETRQKMSRVKPDVEIPPDEPIDDGADYWLLDKGWTNDEDIFKVDKDKE